MEKAAAATDWKLTDRPVLVCPAIVIPEIRGGCYAESGPVIHKMTLISG